MQPRHSGHGAAQGGGSPLKSPLSSAAHLLLGPVRATRRHRTRGKEKEEGKGREGAGEGKERREKPRSSAAPGPVRSRGGDAAGPSFRRSG